MAIDIRDEHNDSYDHVDYSLSRCQSLSVVRVDVIYFNMCNAILRSGPDEQEYQPF